ncbi:uncharacterized protein LOC130742454 [Lotus japonicus]|uniref:uncharacterized protein LOC130742454 n=1 Tax=Lotus japonicus TaxID=34305 RepID=UPI00258C7775|nr:uncharacterized protein LOC130742454 [Lotus japonicus]XP_057450544.1 uncharacterized protein LOC130742454 [Lotus japonicus]
MCAKLNPIVIAGITCGWNLTWCSIGDQEWKECRSNGKYLNVTFHNGKLYAINLNCDKIDIFRVDNDQQKLILLDTICVTFPTVSRRSDIFDVYLVESKGSLLVVKRNYDYGALIHPTIGFDIFKVQERISGDSPHLLVNVESLEDQALFFSGLFYESLSAKDCPGLRGNRIYFIGHQGGNVDSEFGLFSLEEGIIFREPIHDYPINPPIWLLPRYVFECNCKCHPSTMWRPTN